jgi:two-component system, sensor histidine kinase and response regulator
MPLSKAQPGHVLIVDDIIDNLDMLADMLEAQGHEVRIAMSGREALESIKNQAPDLILLDIQMPEMDGYEVCQRVKANGHSKDIPVIFLSALNETADIIKGFDVGGVDYVSKPFQFREVLARVESHMAVSQQRREIEILRERDNQQFEALANLKNKFIHGTVHDLKNPLTGILLYSQLMRSSPPDNEEEIIKIAIGIEQSARKMQQLVTDILDLAQVQVGNQLNLINIHIQPILERVIKNMKVLAQDKNINLTLEVPDDEVKLVVHNSYFERIFDNLVSNAIKYTPEGGDIRLLMQTYDNYVEFIVEDNGLGIPEEDLSKLFEAFYRVRKPSHRKENGSGLGLSVVAAIVDEHGGRIDVESIEGEGSRFIVTMPLPD